MFVLRTSNSSLPSFSVFTALPSPPISLWSLSWLRTRRGNCSNNSIDGGIESGAAEAAEATKTCSACEPAVAKTDWRLKGFTCLTTGTWSGNQNSLSLRHHNSYFRLHHNPSHNTALVLLSQYYKTPLLYSFLFNSYLMWSMAFSASCFYFQLYFQACYSTATTSRPSKCFHIQS